MPPRPVGATNVGNEHGQVLMSVLTDTEGAGLLSMAAGLMRRYRDAGVEPPQLLYVDRDCCSSHGGSKTADMFRKWDMDRLDIWHLMRRFASGVTTESHQLYKPFLQQLSSCIFLWDPEDAARLLKVKKRMLEAQGMTFSSDAEQRIGDLLERVDELIRLYEALSPHDRARVDYPPRYRDRPAQGRFMAVKPSRTTIPGVESLRR